MPFSLLPEVLRAARRQVFSGLRIFWRRSWFYGRLLKGPLPDRIVFHPYDSLPRRLEDADALLHGRFRFNGETVEVREGSIFDKPPPSARWAEALHGFAWLPPLSAAGGDAARTLATNLISQWLKRNARYAEPASSAQVLARRLIHIFAHGRLVLSNSDMLWRSRVFVSLREQARLLGRIAGEAPEGLPRLEAAAALALSGACLDDSARRLDAGLARLETELARQILPDGGHIDRSPEDLLNAYRLTTMVMDALTAIQRPISQELRSAHDRMAPMVRFFRHGDGALALFNGGVECDPRMIAGLLARDEVRGQPFGFARHSGYQRVAAGRTFLVMDCGPPPPGPFSVNAHAGCLSFEFSTGTHRIVVNCGAARDARQAKWDSALRVTAAHSTLVLADTSESVVLGVPWARRLLGPRLLAGATEVETSRVETAQGWSVKAAHNGYLAPFGVQHERQVTLSVQGTSLTGIDRVLPKGKPRGPGGGIPFNIRFHIHPDIRVSTSQGGDILLKLPNGEGWRFRAQAAITAEESVYLGTDTLRRTEQLVLSGTVRDVPAEIGWVFEQIGRE
jgi:uncharacterized heparinase superfamily protein